MNSVDILFVLLVTICIIAIIIILCKKSKKSRNEVVGDAVIEITEKFNNNNLGEAIDNVIQSAFHEVNDINDKENDDNVVINYKSNVYYGNDIDGYSGDGQYHDADPANNNSSVSDHNNHNHNHNHNYIPDKDHHHIHNSIKHHTKNINEEDSGNNLGVKQTHFSHKKHSSRHKSHSSRHKTHSSRHKKHSSRHKKYSKHSKRINGNSECIDCTTLPNYRGGNKCECNGEITCGECNDCTWCIDESLNGNCLENHNASKKNCVNLKSNYKLPDKSQQCTMGGKSMPSPYANAGGGCNLYNNYKDCLSCAEEGYCGEINTNGEVMCLNTIHTKCSIDPKTNPKMNCLHSPEDEPNPGFGCPGRKQPIDPTKNNNDVCEYSPN